MDTYEIIVILLQNAEKCSIVKCSGRWILSYNFPNKPREQVYLSEKVAEALLYYQEEYYKRMVAPK